MEEFIVHPEVRKKLEGLIEKKGITRYILKIECGSNKGDNYLGVIANATVEGVCEKTGQNVTWKWIIKSAHQTETYRNFINFQAAYSREIYMYEKIFPLFRKYEAEKSVPSPFTATASLIMSCLEEFQECLVLTDMKALGYQLKDRKVPFDFNHVRLVMRTYGKFHAISYALKDQKGEVMRKLAEEAKENSSSLLDMGQRQIYANMYGEKAMNSLDPIKDKEYRELFKKYSGNSFQVLLETFELSPTNPYAVIVHGDSWVTNILFKNGDPQRSNYPTEVCLLDFQLAMYGSPAFDLSYFIFTCTDKALRDEHYDKMIRIYYETLCSHLVDLGSDPQKLIPFHALEEQLKRYSVYGLFMSTMVLHLMTSETDELPDLSKKMSDDDVIQSFSYESKNASFYNDRVRGVIVDFVEKGYLDFLK